jgi:LEA14-like dessication related protein
MTRTTRPIALAALLALGLAAPAGAVPQKSEIEISVQEKRILEPTTLGLTLAFVLHVKNLLTVPQLVARYDYRAVIDGAEFLNLQTDLDAPIRLEGREEIEIALPIKITYAYLFAAVPGIRERDQGTCSVTGGITFREERGREKRVPVSFSGEFPIFRGIEVTPLPVEARDLTVGGADVIFKASVGNPNGFPFKIVRLSCRIELVGVLVSESVIGQGVAVDARGEKAVSVPLLLDFFEFGRSLYDGLSQPPVDVRLAGEIELSSVWGTFTFPFDRRAKVAVTRLP